MNFFKKLFGEKQSVAELLIKETDYKVPESQPKPQPKYLSDNENTFTYGTDTSTICVFDIANLKHRLTDTCDWWSIPEDEVIELNKGNLIIAALPADGGYECSLLDEFSGSSDCHLSANLNFDSGEIFIGAGEGISGEGMEPKDWEYLSGRLKIIKPGNYRVDLYLSEINKISVVLTKNSEVKLNNFVEPLELRG